MTNKSERKSYKADAVFAVKDLGCDSSGPYPFSLPSLTFQRDRPIDMEEEWIDVSISSIYTYILQLYLAPLCGRNI
jgi:hypothetical protein